METDAIKKQLNTLPKEYRAALATLDLPLHLQNISKSANLHIDQMAELEVEITLALIGIRSSDEFAENVQEKLNLTDDEAINLTEKVNEEIFIPLRAALQKQNQEPEHHLETPDEILKHIEDGGLELPSVTPPALPIEKPAPAPAPTPVVEESKDLTEHLLKNTVASPHIEETKVEKKYNIDPYREPIM